MIMGIVSNVKCNTGFTLSQVFPNTTCSVSRLYNPVNSDTGILGVVFHHKIALYHFGQSTVNWIDW